MKFTQTILLGLALLVCGLALCGAGLFILLQPAQYKATVRIRVAPEIDDPNDFNPYFIQTSFEIVKSELVLSNAVAALNLNDARDGTSDAEKAKATDTSMKWLRRHLEFSVERNMKIFDMSFTCENPDEAARIANVIAGAYRNYHLETTRQFVATALKSWKERSNLVEKQISVEQTNVDQLRQKIGSQNDASTNQTPESIAYQNEALKLEQLRQQHQLLSAKIDEEKNGLPPSPYSNLPAIVELAKTSSLPVLRNYALAISLLITGLVSTTVGLRWLKTPRSQK